MIQSLVCFRTPHGRCGIDVGPVLGVRAVADMDSLPVPRPDVVGVIDIDGEASPVLSVLGTTGHHVVLLEQGGRRFGILVDEVLGVERIDPLDVGPAPSGQDAAVVGGVVLGAEGLLLVIDTEVLSGRLLE